MPPGGTPGRIAPAISDRAAAGEAPPEAASRLVSGLSGPGAPEIVPAGHAGGAALFAWDPGPVLPPCPGPDGWLGVFPNEYRAMLRGNRTALPAYMGGHRFLLLDMDLRGHSLDEYGPVEAAAKAAGMIP